MPTARMSLLPAIYSALQDLERTLGKEDPITVEVKDIFVQILSEMHRFDSDVLTLVPEDGRQ